MPNREMAIATLEKLSEPLLQQVIDYMEFLQNKNLAETNSQTSTNIAELWSNWFAAVDHLDVVMTPPINDYQNMLIEKYRKQGINL